MPLRKAAVMACSSPCETAASPTATSLSRPGKSSAGETEAFIAAILARPAVRGSGRAKPGLCQEIGDGGAEAGEIDQERVMALRRLERPVVRFRAARAPPVSDLLLLLERRSDGRRAGKEWFSTCRSWWSAVPRQKTSIIPDILT